MPASMRRIRWYMGLDSDHRRLPERFAGSATPQFDFNRWVIDQTHEFPSAYKPNIAFYEARGDTGLRDLKVCPEWTPRSIPPSRVAFLAGRLEVAGQWRSKLRPSAAGVTGKSGLISATAASSAFSSAASSRPGS